MKTVRKQGEQVDSVWRRLKGQLSCIPGEGAERWAKVSRICVKFNYFLVSLDFFLFSSSYHSSTSLHPDYLAIHF
jgi:hypothetical protein